MYNLMSLNFGNKKDSYGRPLSFLSQEQTFLKSKAFALEIKKKK